MQKNTKNSTLPAFIAFIAFIVTFIGIYLFLCYLPGLRIKLYAPPMEYFIESVKHMVFFKTIVSATVGLLVASAPRLAGMLSQRQHPKD